MNYIIALVLLALGLIVIGYLLQSILFPLIGTINLREYLFQRKIKAADKSFYNACKAFSNGDMKAAFSFIEDSFLFSVSKQNLSYADRISRYNFNVVDKLSEILSDEAEPFEALSILEGLFQSRAELLGSLSDHMTSKGNLSHWTKRGVFWASDQFERKIEELFDRCKTNERTIRSHLKSMGERFTKKPATTHASYH